MNSTDQGIDLLECQSCGNLAISNREISCCELPMSSITATDITIEEPTLEQLLRTVFDISPTELDVCLCVMEAGTTTATDLAGQIDYDRSVISRHLNHLAELGMVEKRRQLLDQGGHVYVYTPADVETIRQGFQAQFLLWCRQALHRIQELNREKAEAMIETGSDDPEWTIFRENEAD